MERIVLASASPRRAELLSQIDYDPIVIPAHVDEESIRRERADDLVLSLAQAKLEAVYDRLTAAADGRIHEAPVLAADTVVTKGGRIFEKPADSQEAREMLRELSGAAHTVVTGIAVQLPGRKEPILAHAETVVTFAELSHEEVEWYIESEEWRDVAGAYRIQGRAARFISAIRGSYSNVVGLPLQLVYSILKDQRP